MDPGLRAGASREYLLVDLAIVGPPPAGDPICEVAADEDNQEKSSKEVDLTKKQPFTRSPKYKKKTYLGGNNKRYS